MRILMQEAIFTPPWSIGKEASMSIMKMKNLLLRRTEGWCRVRSTGLANDTNELHILKLNYSKFNRGFGVLGFWGFGVFVYE